MELSNRFFPLLLANQFPGLFCRAANPDQHFVSEDGWLNIEMGHQSRSLFDI